MKLKILTLAITTISSLSFAELSQPKVALKAFTPEIKISSNLTTILPKIGVRVEDKGENINTYLLKKISKGEIDLNNNLSIGLCAEITYIMGVGINQYKHGSNLHYAISDTEKIVNKVEESCKKTRTYVLKNASKEKILQTLENISKKVSKKDSIVFNFSGHGVRYKEKDYLLTSEVNINNASSWKLSALTINSIEDALKRMPLQSAVLIIDAERVKPYGIK